MRRCADTCLTKLISSFPHLLWNGNVLGTALKLLEALSCNLEHDIECSISRLSVASFPWSIQLQVGTYSFRITEVSIVGAACLLDCIV